MRWQLRFTYYFSRLFYGHLPPASFSTQKSILILSYIDFGGTRQMFSLLLIRVYIILLLDFHLVCGYSILDVLGVELIDHAADVFVVGQGYLGK